MKVSRETLWKALLVGIPMFIFARGLYQRWYFQHHLRFAPEKLAMQETLMSPKDAYEAWQLLQYTSFDNSAAFQQGWSKLRTDIRTPLSPQQHLKFLNDSRSLLQMYFRDNMADAFTHYVTQHHPKGEVFTAEKRAKIKRDLDLKDDSSLTIIHAGLAKDAPAPQLAGVCLPASSIRYTQVQRDITPLRELEWKEDIPASSGFSKLPHAFHYAVDFDDIYQAGKKVDLADMRLYAKGSKSHRGQPYIFRFWWCAQENEWRPLEAIYAAADQEAVLLLP